MACGSDPSMLFSKRYTCYSIMKGPYHAIASCTSPPFSPIILLLEPDLIRLGGRQQSYFVHIFVVDPSCYFSSIHADQHAKTITDLVALKKQISCTQHCTHCLEIGLKLLRLDKIERLLVEKKQTEAEMGLKAWKGCADTAKICKVWDLESKT